MKLVRLPSPALRERILSYCPQVLAVPGAVVAGGFLRSVLLREEPKDMDVFGTRPWVPVRLAEALGDWVLDERSTKACVRYKGVLGIRKVDVIRKTADSIEDILDWFDLTISLAAYDAETGEIVADERFFEDAKARVIRIVRAPYLVGTLRRVAKFRAQGYTVAPESIDVLAEAAVQLEETGDSAPSAMQEEGAA